MAKIYHPKTRRLIFAEAALAGLAGGLVFLIVMLAADAMFRGGRWWTTLAIVGSLVIGTPEANSNELNWSTLVGVAIVALIFALVGVGFTQYRPIFRMLKLPLPLAGAIYGAIIWLLVFQFGIFVFKPGAGNIANLPALVVGNVLAGAAIGFRLKVKSA